MKETMRAAVLCDVGRLEVRDVPRPVAGPHDVLVKVTAVGICGTDLHIFAGHGNYNTDQHGRPIPLTSQPQILGHEITGVIEEVGSEVTGLRAGDRVLLDQGLNCNSSRRSPLCEYCATGHSHQCEFYQELGITGLQGGLAQYVAIPGANAVKINSSRESAEVVLAEPLGCIVHSSDAAARANGRYTINAEDPGRRVRAVLICGAGPSGLLFTQYLRNVLGYDGLLIVAEPNRRKRELAAGFGATCVDPDAVDLVKAVQELTKGRRVEYLIEAAGAARLFVQMPGLIRKQATVLLYGHGHSGVDLGVLNSIQFLEPTLVAAAGASGGFDADGRPSTYRRALELIEEGRVKVGDFITHSYDSLEAVRSAFLGDHRRPEYVKGVVSI